MLSILERRIPHSLIRQVRNHITKEPYSSIRNFNQISKLTVIDVQHNLQVNRYKSRRSSINKNTTTQPQESGSSETEEKSTWEDQITDKHTKIMQIPVKSTRIDLILKSGLGIARNKIEVLFYENKIRLNGQKLLKKSELTQEGDEIDIVKGVNVNNPDLLTVARVEVLGVTEKGDSLIVKIRRCKSLSVENYEQKPKPTS